MPTSATAEPSNTEERPTSPVSSIMRYISSTELEADPDDIEKALQAASLEDLPAEPTTSTDMRLPSLRAEEEQRGIWKSGDSLNSGRFKPLPKVKERCEFCQDMDLPVRLLTFGNPFPYHDTEYMQCDGLSPCFFCSRTGQPCSISVLPTSINNPNSQTSPWSWKNFIPSHKDFKGPRDSPYHKHNSLKDDDSLSAGPTKRRAASRAQSVVSAGTSYSAASTHSARYSVKYNRRLSAHQRRHSADSRVDTSSRHRRAPVPRPARPRKRRTASPRDDLSPSRKVAVNGRADYFCCPFLDCPEVFSSRSVLKDHEKSSHLQSYCTFCKKSFSNPRYWRVHEQKHLINIEGLYHLNHMLWYCGVCSIRGLSEPRRYIHIRHHWQEGHTLASWQGEPKAIPLTSSETERLLDLSVFYFLAAAKFLLSSPTSRWRSSTAGLKSFLLNGRHTTKTEDLPPKTSAEKSTDISSIQPEQAKEAARPMVHGLFASIRKTFLRIHTKPP
jgi:hypothetical protein